MRITSTLGRRLAALVAAGAVAAGFAAVVAAPAHAVTLGTLAITPVTGVETTGLSGTLSAACPGDSTGIVGYMTGSGIASDKSIIQSNRPTTTTFAFSSTFKDVFSVNSISDPVGTYLIRIACIGPDFFTEVGDFTQSVTFTSAAGDNTYATVSNATPTTTTLSVGTPDPIAVGTTTTLTATISPAAPGTVQFKRGAVNIGTPVAVNAGVATSPATALPAGTNSLTAVFTSTNPSFAGSTSTPARPYVVASAATISGTARVGSTLSCNSTATPGATVAYKWFLGTKQSATTTKTLKIPSTWKGFQAKCSVTTTKSGNPTPIVQTSAFTAKIGAGLAPVATKKPYITGTLLVGKTLTCNKGTWTSSPTSYKYQWYRGTTALSGKVYSTYKTVSTDKGKYLKCRVTTVKTGYTAGVAYSAAKKIL